MKRPRPLEPRQARFAEEYLRDLDPKAAAIRAGYSEKTARVQGPRLLSNVAVSAEVARLKAARAERVAVGSDDVLRELWMLATADPRELVEARVGACRYCYGVSYQYHETQRERDERERRWLRLQPAEQARDKDTVPGTGEFDRRGGIGYDRTRLPNPECPECHGLGEDYVVVKDQRTLSARAARLNAGVKLTKDGDVAIVMHDPVAALQLTGRHLGMFLDKTLTAATSVADLIKAARATITGNPTEDDE